MNARLAWLAIVACLLVAPAALAANAAPAAASPLVRTADGRLLAPEIARIVERGELVVAMYQTDSPPFYAQKDGVLRGIDIDLAQAIAGELGVKVRFDRTSATVDAVVEMVGNGQADLGISRLGRTLRRSQMVAFSTPYRMLGHAMLIHRVRFAEKYGKQPLKEALRSFEGPLGVIANTSWVEFARRDFPAAKLQPYPSWQALVEAVRHGEVLAAYRDELAVREVLEQDPRLALSLRTVTFTDAQTALSVMVGVRDGTLLSFVNEVIAMQASRRKPEERRMKP
ncbi:ABC transporter substrate-binding protein [Duganella sp. Root336D2]|uniref:substrate-binding periplasmic protein n=1 Tax=Duganella sp. Root336D2 TaxID=1736518 RepID=UPI0006F5AEBD|nr:transporter substrate-binding domain-containing protein [Duganella sp. Root336D2]KQV61426.1 amino acid ABC transporter substrate-binding protein [Duganella sp. Root336D2]